MSESEVNRLKTGTFTFRFETLPPSSCLSHLTLLVSHLSLRDKWNLICDVEVFAGLFFSPAPTRFYSAPTIYSLFVHISAERQRDRLTNESLVCTKLYLFYSSCQESWIYWHKNVNNILLLTRNKVSQRENKLYKNCNPYLYSSCQDKIDPFTVYVTGKFEVRSAHVGVRTFIPSHCVNQRISRQDKT